MSWVTYRTNQIVGVYPTQAIAESNKNLKAEDEMIIILSLIEITNPPADLEPGWYINVVNNVPGISKRVPVDTVKIQSDLVADIRATITRALNAHNLNMSTIREYLSAEPSTTQDEVNLFSISIFNGLRNLYRFDTIDSVVINHALRLTAAQEFANYATNYSTPAAIANFFATDTTIKDWHSAAHLFIDYVGTRTDFSHPTHWGPIDTTAKQYDLNWLILAPGNAGTHTTPTE